MKLSQDTIQILKNFAQINQSILIKPGNVLQTVSLHNVILGEATLTETFDTKVGIYDLNQFLHCISMIPGADVELSDTSIKIIGDGSTITYRTCDPEVIHTPPDKDLSLPSEDVCFILPEEVLQRASKMSAILGCPDITISGDGELIVLSVKDSKNSGSNSFCVDMGETASVFTYNFKVENLKIMAGDYDVVVSKSDIARFKNHSKPLTYYVALEPDSKFVS
jgi:hypothetical protein